MPSVWMHMCSPLNMLAPNPSFYLLCSSLPLSFLFPCFFEAVPAETFSPSSVLSEQTASRELLYRFKNLLFDCQAQGLSSTPSMVPYELCLLKDKLAENLFYAKGFAAEHLIEISY